MAAKSASERARSPRAPRHSLRDAVRYARAIYNGVHRSPIDSHTAYKLMGFAGKSGASATALGSVRQFGLIEGMGDRTRVTELALKVLEPASEKEHFEALVEASNHPEIFRAISDRFEGRVPASDEPLRAFLIRDLGFVKTGAQDCISAFRDTLIEVEHAREGVSESTELKVETAVEPVPHRFLFSNPEERLPESSADEVIRLRLTKDCLAELRLVGQPSARAIANLIRHIELMSEAWEET